MRARRLRIARIVETSATIGPAVAMLSAKRTSPVQSSGGNEPSGSLSSRLGSTTVSAVCTDRVLAREQIPGPLSGWKDRAPNTSLARQCWIRHISRIYRGLGLDLAIVRHLVELHGGDIDAQSEGVGRGARFRVTL